VSAATVEKYIADQKGKRLSGIFSL
jgi:hypothetical protein